MGACSSTVDFGRAEEQEGSQASGQEEEGREGSEGGGQRRKGEPRVEGMERDSIERRNAEKCD